MASLSPQQREAANRLWHAGILSWKLDSAQKLIHAEVMAKRSTDRMVLLAGRAFGKSFTQLLLCFEACMSKPNQHVAFVTKTKKQARANLRQSAETILTDCPRALRPTYLKNDSEYQFKNGSVLYLVGVDSERFDFLRGRALDGACIDESQDIDELDTVVRVILDPCVLRKRGWMLLAGTVPQRDTHDFVTFVREAQGTGHCIVKTIHECPRYTVADVKEMCRRAGGEDSNIWKREYLSILTFTDARAVIPEWTAPRAKKLVREEVRPEGVDRYVGLDFGFARDLTVAVFGYWDFQKATLVIEDELELRGGTTATIAAAVEGKMTALWGPKDMRGTIHMFADNNEQRTLYELRVLHGLRFKASDKAQKKMHLNSLRILIAEEQFVVAPRCKTLIRTLFSATWAKNFSTYDRNEEIGHADALDALLYLARNLDQKKRPLTQQEHWTQLGKTHAPTQSAAAKTLAGCYSAPKETDIRRMASGKLRRRGF